MEEGDGGKDAAQPSPSHGTERRLSRRASDPAKTICTKGCCVLDANETKKIDCGVCLKSFHYHCTGLPVFQIHHFLHTKNYRKFICESCTKIAEHLKAVIPVPPPPNPSKQVLDLEKIIKEKQMEIDTLMKTNRIVQAEYKELFSSNNETQKSYEKEKNKHAALQNKTKELKTGITKYEEKIASLESSLKANDHSLPELVTKKIEEFESKLLQSLPV